MANKNYIKISAKIILALLIYGFLIYKLQGKVAHVDWKTLTHKILLTPLMALLILLWCINILTEGMKWQVLLNNVHKITLKESVISVFQGFAFGIFTPFRIGEWFGRVVHFGKQRKAGITLAMVGSIFQNSIIGMIGGLFLIFLVKDLSVLKNNLIYGMMVFATIIAAVSLLFMKFSKRWEMHFQSLKDVLRSYPKSWYYKVFGLTFLRYLIFSFQLGIMLVYMTDIPPKELINIIPVYFFVITFAPAYSFIELGIRIASGLLLFSPQSEFALEVSAAIVLIWVLNVGITAVVGSIAVFRQNFLTPPKDKLRPLFKYKVDTKNI